MFSKIVKAYSILYCTSSVPLNESFVVLDIEIFTVGIINFCILLNLIEVLFESDTNNLIFDISELFIAFYLLFTFLFICY